MSLIKWEPFGEFDRFFNDMLPAMRGNEGFGFDLAVDLFEEDDAVVAKMNLPGIDPEKIDVSVEDTHLRIAGSREEEEEKKDREYFSKEIRRGSFERVVRLPRMVSRDGVRAEYEGGVLTVRMPKSEHEKGSRIAVEVKK